jgi:hypothetical protein
MILPAPYLIAKLQMEYTIPSGGVKVKLRNRVFTA